MRSKNGFTLVELSIVMVIIGLVVGGIIIGRDLIASAGLRKTIQEVEMLNAAMISFKTKYECIAGDCVNATVYFGTAPTCPTTWGTPPSSPTTCNGNNDGMILNEEMFYVMAQLSNANLVAQKASTTGCCGTFSGAGTAGAPNGYQSAAFGSKWGGQTGYMPYFATDIAVTGISSNYGVDNPTAYFFTPASNQHYWLLGGTDPLRGNLPSLAPVMTAAQSLNIDTKIDDGKPGTGSTQAIRGRDFWSLYADKGIPYCSTSEDSATAIYDLTGGNLDTCSMFFLMAY